MHVRPATVADAAALAALRVALLEEPGAALPEPDRTALLRANEAYFVSHTGTARWRDWVAETDGQVVAAASLLILVRPPYPGNLAGLDAYFLNLYTRPEARGQGAAPRLLSAALDHARRHGVGKVLLHATEAGRPLYLREGFEPSAAYMELRLPVEL